MADPPGAPRLAGHGICPHRLGPEGDAEADCDERHLSANIEGHASPPITRSRKSPLGPRCPAAPVGRNDPRSGAGDQRPAGGEVRGTLREALSTAGIVERVDWCGGIRAGPRGKSLSPEPV